MLLVLIVAAALGFVTWLVLGGSFSKHPVTEAQIEHAVARRPHGHVQSVFCNEVFVPSQTPVRKAPHTWTCDTYLGRSAAEAQNGPSYKVTVSDDRIESIRRVPTH
jgi:uncharacterized protein YgbK (DUF1537 family)